MLAMQQLLLQQLLLQQLAIQPKHNEKINDNDIFSLIRKQLLSNNTI